MTIKAVIFDFDETLVSSLSLHCSAYIKAFQFYGLSLTPERYYQGIGGKGSEVLPYFLNEQVSPVSLLELHNKKVNISLELLEEKPPLPLETANLLPVFYGTYKMAIASMGTNTFIIKLLKQLNWLNYFDVILASSDVARGKPHPEIFLKACEKMKVIPSECILFEDHLLSLETAKELGMLTFNAKKIVSG